MLRPDMIAPLAAASLHGPLFSSAAMRAVVDDRARVQRMLDFEAALARAEAALGVIPANAAEPIARACVAERFDIAALGEAAVAGSTVAIPLVAALVRAVREADVAASGFVHWGATSQDVVDTALVLELSTALAALDADLAPAIDAFAAKAQTHRHQPMAARTLLQQAVPIPFGLKLAGYAAALARARSRLQRLRAEALVLQFGGAAGTLAPLGPHGLAVAERLAALLGLPLPDAPWHSHRDRLAEVASALAILAGTCGKIARDTALLMQTEVGEVSEPAAPGRGASSTMPHKRNPVAAAMALACAGLAPNLAAAIIAAQVQEHERAVGAWQAEWAAFPMLLLVVSGAVAAVRDLAEGLEVHGVRMRQNLDLTGGLVMAEALALALGERIGKARAHALVAELCRTAQAAARPLAAVAAADARVTPHLSAERIETICDPARALGTAQIYIDRLLASLPAHAARKPA